MLSQGPHQSFTAAGWTPARLQSWFAMGAGLGQNMVAADDGGSGILAPERDLFVIECDADHSIAITACVWTTPNDTKKTIVDRNGSRVMLAMPSTGEINWVASRAAHRGHGLGHIITLAVLHRLRELGKKSCWLHTDDWRIPAIKT